MLNVWQHYGCKTRICKQREDTGSLHCNVTTTGPSTKLLLSKQHELFAECKLHIKSKPPF